MPIGARRIPTSRSTATRSCYSNPRQGLVSAMLRCRGCKGLYRSDRSRDADFQDPVPLNGGALRNPYPDHSDGANEAPAGSAKEESEREAAAAAIGAKRIKSMTCQLCKGYRTAFVSETGTVRIMTPNNGEIQLTGVCGNCMDKILDFLLALGWLPQIRDFPLPRTIPADKT